LQTAEQETEKLVNKLILRVGNCDSCNIILVKIPIFLENQTILSTLVKE
jgi:hypothetical protein